MDLAPGECLWASLRHGRFVLNRRGLPTGRYRPETSVLRTRIEQRLCRRREPAKITAFRE
jgi:hypothetical protein